MNVFHFHGLQRSDRLTGDNALSLLDQTATTRPFIAARSLPSLLLAAAEAGADFVRSWTENVAPWCMI
jgi:hypothetical protein